MDFFPPFMISGRSCFQTLSPKRQKSSPSTTTGPPFPSLSLSLSSHRCFVCSRGETAIGEATREPWLHSD